MFCYVTTVSWLSTTDDAKCVSQLFFFIPPIALGYIA